MKLIFFSLCALVAILSVAPTVFADQYVNGYYKSNGTYVNGYYRSSPDSSPYNNFSYPGNTNPYTGVTAGGNSSSYLNTYYSESRRGYATPSFMRSYTLPTYAPPTSLYSGSSYSSYTPTYLGLSSDDIFKEVSGGWKSYGILHCDSGYYEKKNKCVKDPANGYSVGSTIYCNSGFIENAGKCTKPTNGEIIGTTLYCDEGFYIHKNSCATIEKLCKAEYGSKAIAVGTDSCNCKAGYKWNTKETECVKDRKSSKVK